MFAQVGLGDPGAEEHRFRAFPGRQLRGDGPAVGGGGLAADQRILHAVGEDQTLLRTGTVEGTIGEIVLVRCAAAGEVLVKQQAVGLGQQPGGNGEVEVGVLCVVVAVAALLITDLGHMFG